MYISLALFQSLWAELWHYGLGAVLIVGFLAAAYFSPIAKTWFFAGAIIVAAALGGYTVGIQNANTHCTAKAVAVDRAVKKIVKSTTTKRGRAWRDPYDQQDN